VGNQPSAAESTPAKHWLTSHGSTLSDKAFVLLRQPTGIFNMRGKQAELFAVLTPFSNGTSSFFASFT